MIGVGGSERPGEFPFTRGIHPRMYADRLWTMRQYAGYGTAAETNRRFRMLLEQGQTGLSVAFDLPTQMGLDPDHPMARGEVGRAGVSIAALPDVERLFEGIPPDRVSVSMTINATAAILLMLYAQASEGRGVSRRGLRGTVQNDILKEFIARGTYIYPPEPSMRLAVDVMEYCVREMPEWNFISVSGYHMREAGATAAQEVGFTLANAIAYVEQARRRGVDIHAIGRRISFFLSSDNGFMQEIAKFRAARRLWARIMRDRFGATDLRAMMFRFHVQTAGSTLAAKQPKNNLVRVTIQALQAVLGGAQSIHTNAYDEALGLPTEETATLALRTQQIIAFETGLADVADPFGGSEVLERLTEELEGQAEAIIGEVDRRGGAVAAVCDGYQAREIQRSALETQRRIERGEQVVVGVNRYVSGGADAPPRVLKVDERFEEERRRWVAEYRRGRGERAVGETVGMLERAARGSDNLVPHIAGCVRAGLTVGEISEALARVFGRYRPAG